MRPTDEFNYLAVLVSIVLGLGLTHLLTAVGRLVQVRARVRGHWPTAVWVVLLFLIHVQAWWAIYELRDHRGWTFAKFLVVLLTPTSLYLMAALLLPDVDLRGAEPVDLGAHYRAQARWFFGAAAALLVASLLRPLAIDGRLPLDLDRGIQLVFLACVVTAAVVRREAVHRALAVAGAALFALYVAALFTRLR